MSRNLPQSRTGVLGRSRRRSVRRLEAPGPCSADSHARARPSPTACLNTPPWPCSRCIVISCSSSLSSANRSGARTPDHASRETAHWCDGSRSARSGRTRSAQAIRLSACGLESLTSQHRRRHLPCRYRRFAGFSLRRLTFWSACSADGRDARHPERKPVRAPAARCATAQYRARRPSGRSRSDRRTRTRRVVGRRSRRRRTGAAAGGPSVLERSAHSPDAAYRKHDGAGNGG